MKQSTFNLLFFIFTFLLISSCTGTTSAPKLSKMEKEQAKASKDYRNSEKWGEAGSQIIDVAPFHSVRTEGHVEIVYMQSETCSVKAFGNTKAIEQYEYQVNEATGLLEIKLKDYHYDQAGNFDDDIPGITVFVTSPFLEDVHVYGAGDVGIKSDLRQQRDLNIYVLGKGDVDAKEIEALGLRIDINGKGDVNLKKAECKGNATFTLNGKGDVSAKVECANTHIEVNGEGDVKLKVKCNDLTAICNGKGDIVLRGECNTLNKHDGAAAAIDSRNLKAKRVKLI